MFFESGGAVYHLRGARSARNLWRPTRTWLSHKLSEWSPPETELIIIGPSAGYLLDSAPLERFTKLIAVDRDPWSKILFRLLHPSLNVTWIKQDLIPSYSGAGVHASDPLRNVLEAHPNAAVLFANCLGQLWLEDATWARAFFDELPGLLKGRSVFSVHDRLSFTGGRGDLVKAPQSLEQKSDLELNRRPEPEPLLRELFGETVWEGRSVTDHEVPADSLFTGNSLWSYKVWSVTPNQHHLLEAAYRKNSKI